MNRLQFNCSSTIDRLMDKEKYVQYWIVYHKRKIKSPLNEAKKRMEKQKPYLSLSELPGILNAHRIFTQEEFNRWMHVRCKENCDEPVADLIMKLILYYYDKCETNNHM